MNKISPQDALVYIMVTTSAADTAMTDAELASIGNVVSRLPVFQGFDPKRLPKLASDCYALLADEDGLEKFSILRMMSCLRGFTRQPMHWLLKSLPPICMSSRKSWSFFKCCAIAGISTS